jgi:hypothetical protein
MHQSKKLTIWNAVIKLSKKCLEEIRKLDELEDAEFGESDGETIPDELADPKARNEKSRN